MVLSELIRKSGITVIAKGGKGDPAIIDIAYDSRQLVPGSLYVAIAGTKVDGDDFIHNAIERGAVAVLSENSHPELALCWVQASNVRSGLGLLGRALWNIRMVDYTMVGITGTNGKTTIAHLYEALFASVKKTQQVWMFGTIEYHIGTLRQEATHTTPEALQVMRHIGTTTEKPATIVMEISSHSLALDRVGGLLFDLAVFTNLTQDHLDFHLDMDSYYKAKERLFLEYLKDDGHAIVNIDDPYGKRIAAAVDGKRCMTYGQASDADVCITGWKCDWDGCRLDIEYRGLRQSFTSTLRGFFNVYNMAALVAGAFSKGLNKNVIQESFNRILTIEGRFERVIPEASFAVVIDYAHTPDALLNVLRTVKEMTRGRVLCVFGCGGDRDRTKRPVMGAAVAELCDEAWITSDNPRSEEPVAIINDIIEGIPLDFPYQVFPDRREAITSALRSARRNDCLLIAGKGHEKYQEINGVKHHFDDKEVAEEQYALLLKEAKNHG